MEREPLPADCESEVAARTQDLEASELSYRRLFESAQDGILILDVETGRIDDVNPFLCTLLEFTREEMVGRTVAELSPFKDFESNTVMLERLQRDGYVRYDDLPLETKSGRHIAVEFVSNVYQAGDRRVIQCNIRETTKRKLAEDEASRLAAELDQRVAARTVELQAANEELEVFSYSVSHDLRAPVRHVIGFVQLLEEDAAEVLSEKSRRYLGAISQAARHMGELIDGLLALSRIGRSEMHMALVDLNQLVQETLGDVDNEVRNRAITWDIGPLPTVRGDRALLRLAFVNVIANAVKFTNGRAEAEIEVKWLTDDLAETVISIRDNGAGFDQQYAGKLFGVFQRLHSQLEFEGTGIGLANVQRILRRHGGRVWATGAVDVGATFFLAFPVEGTP